VRILGNCIIFAALSAAVASSPQLQSRYGQPDLERYEVRSGLSLTVQYGRDRLVCQARIGSPESLIRDSQPPSLMPSRDVSEVLEEVAPVAERGKQISNGSFQSSTCGVGTFADYQNVWILRAIPGCSTPTDKRDVSILVSFKRDICPKSKPPVSITREATPD
jgi:hypothetical protein